MRLSTKGRYGARVLLDLSLCGGKYPVPLKAVAERQSISLQYLEQLIGPLIAAGMVRSSRGARGGVWLARPPEQIRLIEVIEILEGSTAPVECVDRPVLCPRSETCATRDVWSNIKTAIDDVLQSITLQDLAERQKKKDRPGESMYYI